MTLCQSKRPFVNVLCGVAILLAVAVYCPSASGAVLFEDDFSYTGNPNPAKWVYASSGATIQANGSYAELNASGDIWAYVKTQDTFPTDNTISFEYRRDSTGVTGAPPTFTFGSWGVWSDMVWKIEMSWESGNKDKIIFESPINGTGDIRGSVLIAPDVWYRIELTNSGTNITAKVFLVGDGSQVGTTQNFIHDAVSGPYSLWMQGGGYPEGGTTAYDFDNVQVIPEPATMAILGLGGIGMLVRRRR